MYILSLSRNFFCTYALEREREREREREKNVHVFSLSRNLFCTMNSELMGWCGIAKRIENGAGTAVVSVVPDEE